MLHIAFNNTHIFFRTYHFFPMASFLKLPIIPYSPKPSPKPVKNTVICAALPARDRVIDFGKYKGRMLGTLPSTYLKWVSNNLRARDFEEWAQLADQVLLDPVYNDRVEWEYADKLLNGDVLGLGSNNKSLCAVSELVELSQRFGWDNEDKIGWSKVNFQMLGTSKGGRIPRADKKTGNLSREGSDSSKSKGNVVKVSETRIERRERLRTRSVTDARINERRKSNVGSEDGGKVEVYSPFPGRESLLKKVLNRRKTV